MPHDAVMQNADPALAVFEQIALEAGPALGHRLFTVTRFDAAAMEVQRVYSSDPGAYPVGGRKRKRDTAWGRHVLIEGKPLACEGDQAIARMFDDHAVILGLGIHSSINAPVLAGGRCVGVLNFLMTGATVSAQQLRAACDLASRPAVVAALAGIPDRPTEPTSTI